MINIDPKKSTILEFSVSVEGSTDSPKPRLVIPISKNGVSLIFEGEINDNKVQIDVSDLLKLTDSKQFSGKLEVIVEGNIFVPWEDELVIKKDPKVSVDEVTHVVTEDNTGSNIDVKSNILENTEQTEPSNKKPSIMKVKKKSIEDMFFDK